MVRKFPNTYNMNNKPVRPAIKKAVKAVGKAVTAPIRWVGQQVEKEMRMNKAKDDSYRSAGKSLNTSYSGLSTKKNLATLKRGMQGKKR